MSASVSGPGGPARTEAGVVSACAGSAMGAFEDLHLLQSSDSNNGNGNFAMFKHSLSAARACDRARPAN
eukprot:CAMPEP_0206144124 /NCGR_PEP_ID=MMETSP1473-20131121/23091_1 /ASSEMBLY_ACC=CAM_ASM_001109 /TAXON_ID=1461547 /ORGANISM="Stichococcus sp, Strain RCC1054" /LENGTH=68 /DNA_ID=CAMNT_0053539839 /DNA_START=412 /DNA_END=618 /DNA_ORIENTATION=-